MTIKCRNAKNAESSGMSASRAQKRRTFAPYAGTKRKVVRRMTALDLVIIMAAIFGGVSGLFALGNFIIEVVCVMSPRAKAYVDERNAEMQDKEDY